jgi:hypothetical protein
MILDNEKQREALLYCVKNTYFAGTSEALMEALTNIAKLQQEIQIATIAEIKDGDK